MFLALLFLTLVAALAAQEPPRFRGGVDAVTVDVVVVDRDGRPVPGLTRADFTLLEDGRPQRIAEFQAIELPAPPPAPVSAAEEAPLPSAKPVAATRVSSNARLDLMPGRAFVVVFDDLGLTWAQADVARDAASALIGSLATSEDAISLAVTSTGAWYHARGAGDRPRLLEVLSRVKGKYVPDPSAERMSDFEALRIHQYADTTVAARVRRRYEYNRVAGLEPPGRDRDDMPRVGETRGNVGVVEPYIESRAAGVYAMSAARTSATLGLVARAVESLRVARGRKSVILLSKGFVYDTEVRGFRTVSEAARRANVAIYFIDAQGLLASTPGSTADAIGFTDARDIGAAFFDLTLDSEGAVSVAEDSGGFAVRNTNDLAAGVRRIADESRIYYLLGYEPDPPRRDGKFHKLEVKVRRPGVTVRARKGYFAASGAAAPSEPAALDPDVRRALDAPREFTEVPVRATALVFDEATSGRANVLIASEVDIRGFALEPQDDRLTDVLEFALASTHLETGLVTEFDQVVNMNVRPATLVQLSRTGYGISRTLTLAPGTHQVRVVARDRNSGRLGSVTHVFEVPPLDGFRVSTPILTESLVTEEAAPGVPKAVVQARRGFAAGSTLYCQFSVYGAARDGAGATRVSSSWTLRRGDGGEVRRSEARPLAPGPDGALVRLYGISLAGLSPGPYVLELDVRDEVGVRAVQSREGFTVDPGVGVPVGVPGLGTARPQ